MLSEVLQQNRLIFSHTLFPPGLKRALLWPLSSRDGAALFEALTASPPHSQTEEKVNVEKSEGAASASLCTCEYG